MPRTYRSIFSLFLLLGTALLLFISSKARRVAAVDPGVPQTLWSTYWTTQPGFTSTLEMKNNLMNQPLNVNVSLYSALGKEYPLDPVHLGPRQTAVIDLNRVIATRLDSRSLPADQEGTVEVTFSAPTPSALMGSVSVANPERGTDWNFFLYARRPDPAVLPLHGLFWFQNGHTDGFIALANISDEFLSLTPRFELGPRSYSLPPISLAPGQGAKIQLRKELNRLGLDDVTGGGIEFTWHGQPDALKAHGALSDDHGFSAEIDFTRFESYAEQQTFYLRTPRFAIGRADPRLGLGTRTSFSPILALHNFDEHPLDVALSVGYPKGETTQHVDVPLSLAPGDTQVLSLYPYLKDAVPADVPWASLQLSYFGTRDVLGAAMVSVSQDGEHSIRSVLNWTEGSLREGWYWTADAEHDTLVSILNTDSEAARLAISLDYYAGGSRHSYRLPERTLQPGASTLLDIGEIIASGRPDADGQVFPPGVTSGGYRVRKVGPRLGATITTEALVFDRRRRNFLTFYNTCCGVQDTQFSPSSFLGPVGPLGAVQVMQQDYCSQMWSDVTSGCTFGCGNTAVATVQQLSGAVTGVAPGSTFVNTQISFQRQTTVDTCRLQNLSNNTPTTVNPKVTLSCSPTDLALGPTAPASTTNGTCTTTSSPAGGSFGWSVSTNTTPSPIMLQPGGSTANFSSANPSAGVGDTAIVVAYTVNNISAVAFSAPITVHKPTSLAVLSDTTNPTGQSWTVNCLANPGDGTCNPGSSTCTYSSYLRTRQYSVVDQLNPPNQFVSVGISTATVTEQLPTSTTCPDASTITGSAMDTVFFDRFALGSRCCLPRGPGCSANTNPVQTISVNGIAVRTETINWTCTGVTLTP